MPRLPSSRFGVWPAVLLVLAVALVLRCGHLWALHASFAGTGLFSVPLVDAEHHWKEALSILDGNSPLRDGVPWKGPGYSYFLAALAALFGRSLGALRWPLAVLGSINCALLVILARRVLDLRWATAAGLLAAANGLLIVYDTEPYQPTLLVTLIIGALLLLTQERRHFVGAGVLLGLACLVHAAYLLPAALLVLWAFRKSTRNAAVLVVAVAATIAPVTLNNVIRHGEPVLISWNGGINVFAANHPTFDQRGGNATQAWGRIMAAPVDAGIDSVSARDRLYLRLTLHRALRYPVATVGVLLEKAVVFFSPVEYSSNFRIYDLRERSPVIFALLGRWGPVWFPFGLWAPAAVIGLIVLRRRGADLGSLLMLLALGVMLANVLVFSTARYRAPVVFFGCIWVAAALEASWNLWTARRMRRLVVGAATYAAVGALLALAAVPQQNLPLPYEIFQARAMTPGGPFEEAADWAERAVARDPSSPYLLLFASELYGAWGKRDRQRQYLRRLLAIPGLEPDTIDAAHERLAGSFVAQRRFAESRTELLEALAVGVDDAEWRGYPHYPLGIGPIRSCVLKLRLADVELRREATASAAKLLEEVRETCPLSDRLTDRLQRLERRLPT